jgi:hypothetical protein
VARSVPGQLLLLQLHTEFQYGLGIDTYPSKKESLY